METKNYINEVWKPIMGYVGLYEVSNFGRVRSVDRTIEQDNQYQKYSRIIKGRIIIPAKNKGGYLRTTLCKDNKKENKSVHRLVAEAFIPNPYNLPCVGHKDETPSNNCVDNLYWTTHEANNNYGTRNHKISVSMTNGKLSKPVEQYTLEGKFIAWYPSIMEAERITKICNTNISAYLTGRVKTPPGGFIWKRA